jgi:hypothetical protein
MTSSWAAGAANGEIGNAADAALANTRLPSATVPMANGFIENPPEAKSSQA